MAEEKTKTVKLDQAGIENLPNDKPVVYKILDQQGENIYTGVAKRGRVKERLTEHLSTGPDPIRGGVKVEIQQKKTITDAEKTESNIIARTKPKLNKRGK
jgi:excinuclease UvrABC nuclease subunit